MTSHTPGKPTKSYDVLIVGAGMAGQSCAKTLAQKGISVLLIDTREDFDKKVCAEGITTTDTEFIPETYYNLDFQQARISYKDKTYTTDNAEITSIDRGRFLRDQLEDIRSYPNITVRIPLSFSEKTGENTCRLSNGTEVNYRYLVGADGPNSTVRKSLGIPSKRTALAIQYLIDEQAPRFELILNSEIPGYFWIFPHRGRSSVGVGDFANSIPGSELRKKLDAFIERSGFEVDTEKFQASIINCDYRGYRFGNAFLVGDAGGFTPSLTGKGIYPAILSGIVAGEEILAEIQGKSTEEYAARKEELRSHLKKKRILDGFAGLLTFSITRRCFFSLGIRLANVRAVGRVIGKVAL